MTTMLAGVSAATVNPARPKITLFAPECVVTIPITAASRRSVISLRLLGVVEAIGRTLDSGLALCCLATVLPLMLLIGLAILIGGGGPVIYRQRRIGCAGRPYAQPEFSFLKFRSMVQGTSLPPSTRAKCSDGVRYKNAFDPRVTRVGRFIRTWSLDELPQLWNVVRGDMALVGPRPPIPEEVERYAVSNRRRLHGLPGITGTWQISGRATVSFLQQVEMDAKYLVRRTWRRDIAILIKTPAAVISGNGAW